MRGYIHALLIHKVSNGWCAGDLFVCVSIRGLSNANLPRSRGGCVHMQFFSFFSPPLLLVQDWIGWDGWHLFCFRVLAPVLSIRDCIMYVGGSDVFESGQGGSTGGYPRSLIGTWIYRQCGMAFLVLTPVEYMFPYLLAT